jgi:hypothetical protein
VKLTIAAVLLSATSSIAFADCPSSPDDLATGITVTFDDGSVTQLTRDADGMIVERTEYNNEAGLGFISRSKFGFAHLEATDTDKGEVVASRQVAYDYGSVGLDLVDRPETEMTTYTIERKVTFADGYSEDERVTFRTREYAEQQWGNCAYRVLPVEVSNFDSDDGRAQVYAYVPDLDVAFFVSVNEWDTPVFSAQPVSIVKGITATEQR